MEFAKIAKQEIFDKELASQNMTLTSTLKSLSELGYEYVKDLGIGQFGTVVEMIQPSSKKHCAIKFVKEDVITDGELYVWPDLCHKNILKLLGFHYLAEDRTFIFITKNYPFSLDEKLGDVAFIFDPKAFDRAVSWIKDVAKGIAYLHGKGVAHMDIKTNNVLISDDDRAVVTDFGSLSSTEKPSFAYTSPLPYRSPETYGMDGSWEAVDGLKYDTWTIGMLCIRVLTRESFSQNVRRRKNFWPKNIYPCMFENLQKKTFVAKMGVCFPRSQNCSVKVEDLLNLIKACFQLNPKKRVTVKETLNHRIFGGEVMYELEENNPWNIKCDYEEIERLLCQLKACQKSTSDCAKKCYENKSVKEKEVDAESKLMAYVNNGTELTIHPVEEIKKAFNKREIKIDFENRVTISAKEVTNADRSDRSEKIVLDTYFKKTVFKDLEHERPEDCKTDKRMAVEIILSARNLYKDVENQHEFGVYLKEMDSRLKQVPQTKRTNKVVEWAREKKNSFSKMFARYRSTK